MSSEREFRSVNAVEKDLSRPQFVFDLIDLIVFFVQVLWLLTFVSHPYEDIISTDSNHMTFSLAQMKCVKIEHVQTTIRSLTTSAQIHGLTILHYNPD